MIVNKSNHNIRTNRVCQEEILTEILDSIRFDVPEVHDILLVSVEGLPIASTRFNTNKDETVISAMTAALISVAEQASLELDKGEPSEFIVECPKGLIVLKRLNEDALISVVTREGVRLGLLLFSLNKVKRKICQNL